MAIKTVLKILCDKKLPKRTTDEAIKFHKAIDRDEKLLPEIEISKIESTDFTEIPLPYAVDDSEIQDVFYSKETGEIFDGKN
jgi:recombinational DNA repair protein RecT